VVSSKGEQKQLYDWMLSREWDVFGTLKFQPIHLAGDQHCHKVLKQYWNKLDRVIYGKAAEKGFRVERWCLAHEGSHNDNYHVHFVAKAPIDPDLFCCLSNTLWTKQDRITCSIDHNWITPALYRDRVANYLTKEVWKLGGGSFDAELSFEKHVPFELNDERRTAQELRTARAMSSNEERAARMALVKHKAETLRRLALRDKNESGKATY
jgi:hypothetical protein